MGEMDKLKVKHCQCCNTPLTVSTMCIRYGNAVCPDCYAELEENEKFHKVGVDASEFNNPTHYHMYDMDTITFLKHGFPPDVLESFLAGNVVKYVQRYKLKNGRDDLVKAVDYAKRLLDWYDESREPRE